MADTAAAVTKTFAWDHLGRMTHAEVNNGGVTKSVDYANNPAGKRFMRVAGGVTKAWTYQGDNIASVESTTSPTLHSVYSGSGLGGVAERDDVDTAGSGSTASRFYLYNHRGDVVGVSDASGNLTSAYDYDAYGAVSQSVQSGGGSAPTDDILFTGKDLDPDTGLYYFNARWYDPEAGRFLSRSPFPADSEYPYAFCQDAPTVLADPSGLYHCTYHIAEHRLVCSTDNTHGPVATLPKNIADYLPAGASPYDFDSNNFTAGNNDDPSCPDCKDNPEKQGVEDHGPLPTGCYTVGPRYTDGTHKHDLTPIPGTDMQGRSGGFQFHGHGTTQGCIMANVNSERDLLTSMFAAEPNSTITVVR